MVQIAAHALGVPITKVHLSETSTDKVPNTSATAASVSSGSDTTSSFIFWRSVLIIYYRYERDGNPRRMHANPRSSQTLLQKPSQIFMGRGMLPCCDGRVSIEPHPLTSPIPADRNRIQGPSKPFSQRILQDPGSGFRLGYGHRPDV